MSNEFDYLLNAMEHAAQAEYPAAHGYALKRAAVLSYVADLRARLEKAEKDAASKQARIDELMLEYCPSEMPSEQLAEWARNQKPVEILPFDLDIAKERTA